jgi:predicted ribosomally synthesized peptide with nif11-like leader
MSEEQLAALLAKIKDDAGLQEKLKGAADLDAVLAIAKDAGFDVSKAAWLRYQANQTLQLSDEELEKVAGGDDLIGVAVAASLASLCWKYPGGPRLNCGR